MTSVDLISAVLRGEATMWTPPAGPRPEDTFVGAALEHNVGPLLVWQLQRAGTLDDWPEPVQTALMERARREALFEVGREGEVSRVLAALDRAGLPALLMKGAALAYTRYPEPWVRPRLDTDVIVRGVDERAASGILLDLGYEQANVLTGEFVTNEIPYVRRDRLGVQHVIDLHRKINNRPLIANLLSFDELWAESVAAPVLGDSGRALGDIHALLHACVHRVTHHRNSENLLWAYDIHMLAGRLGEAGFDRFVAVAREKGLAAICARGLKNAIGRFHTAVPPGALQELSAVSGEPSETYLGLAPWRGDVRLSDLRALDGWRAKLQLVREVVLPDSAYMAKRYECTSRAMVPALHVHRLARGTWRLLRRFTE